MKLGLKWSHFYKIKLETVPLPKNGWRLKMFYKTDLSASYPIKCFVTIVQNKITFFPVKIKWGVFRVARGRGENRLATLLGNASINPQLFFK